MNKGAVTLGIVSWNLSHNFIGKKLHKKSNGVKPPKMNMSQVFVAVSVASRIRLYFSQRLLERKRCKTCSFQRMLHYATSRSTCLATKLPRVLQNYRVVRSTKTKYNKQITNVLYSVRDNIM